MAKNYSNQCISNKVNSINLKIFTTKLGYKSLSENLTSILEKDKALVSYRYMKGYIIQNNFEGQEWESRLLIISLIVTWRFRITFSFDHSSVS